MCTMLVINGSSVKFISEVKYISDEIYQAICRNVDIPWADSECMCVVDFEKLAQQNPQLNINMSANEFDLVYTINTVGAI